MATSHSPSDEASSHKKTSVLDSLRSAGSSVRRFITHSSLTDHQKADLQAALDTNGNKKAELERYQNLKASYDKMKKIDAGLAVQDAVSPLSGHKNKDGIVSQSAGQLKAMERTLKEMEENNPLIKKELDWAQRHGKVDKVPDGVGIQKKSVSDTLGSGFRSAPSQPSSRNSHSL